MLVRKNKGKQQKTNGWKTQEIKTKICSFLLNETIEPIVLDPQAKRSKVQDNSENSKILQDAK